MTKEIVISVLNKPSIVLLSVQGMSMLGILLAGLLQNIPFLQLSSSWVLSLASLQFLIIAPEIVSFNLLIERQKKDVIIKLFSNIFFKNLMLQFLFSIFTFLVMKEVGSQNFQTSNLIVISTVFAAQLSLMINPILINIDKIKLMYSDGLVNFFMPMLLLFEQMELLTLLLILIIIIKISFVKNQQKKSDVPALTKNLLNIISLKSTAMVRSMFPMFVIAAWDKSVLISDALLFLVPILLRVFSALSGLAHNIFSIERLQSMTTVTFGKSDRPIFLLMVCTHIAISLLPIEVSLLFAILLIEFRHIFYANKYLTFYFTNKWIVNFLIALGWSLALYQNTIFLFCYFFIVDIIFIFIKRNRVEE